MRIGSNNTSGGRYLTMVLGAMVALSVGGCADYINTNNAGMESTRIIKNLRKVETAPEPNVPLPYFFKAPPKILEQTVGGHVEYKLFYFCQHHTSPEMQEIVHTGFASELFDEKGKSTRVIDYNVFANPATNQLIVRCPAREDAEAVLDFLREADVPVVQVKIKCLVSEIYADKTLDWETTLAIDNLVQPTGLPFGDAIRTLVEEPGTPAAFPGASLRELARERMGLQVGYLSSSENFMAMVDTLESEGYLKILMNPTLEVVNGKQAKILSSQKVPLQETYLTSGNNAQWVERRTEYEDVVDSLTITPHVYGDGYIGLETSILLGSKLTPEGIKQVPIITKKQIDNKENRIRPGESLVIGGLRKVERRDVLRGIPGLKDIPLLGVLFSGRDFEERAVETIFILTPTISTGGIPREEMIEEVKRKRGESTDDEEAGLDPFGTNARDKEEERILEDAEEARLEAEAEKAVARDATREAADRIEKAESETEIAKGRSARMVAEAQKMIAEAAAARTEAVAKGKAADEAKAAADKAIADAATVKAEAEKAVADAAAKVKAAEVAQAEAAKVAADATKTKEEAAKAKADAEAIAKAAETAKGEADSKAKAADEAKLAADKAVADAAQTKKEAEEAKTQAEAKAKAAEAATADALNVKTEAEAKADAADRAVAEAEKIIGKSPAESQPEQDNGDGSAKAEDSPAPEDQKPAAEGANDDPNKPAPAKPAEDGDAAVAKEKSEPVQNSTPAEEGGKGGDIIIKPAPDENKSTLQTTDEHAEPLTAKESGEASEQNKVNSSSNSEAGVSKDVGSAPESEYPKSGFFWSLVLSVLSL
ncbi:MAG TPA: hypothetical protein VJJ98_09390 [Sedimentisphaerales bacterium]|nr:hypothetical protein [Sedimentisphaerales bacterium]